MKIGFEMKDIYKIFLFFNASDKIKIYLLIIHMVCVATFEVLSLAILLPFLQGLVSTENVNELKLFIFMQPYFDGLDTRAYLSYLGFCAIVLIFITFILRITNLFWINKFCYNQQTVISSRLLNTYMGYSFERFKENKASDLIRKCGSEIDKIIVDVFIPFFKMIASFASVVVTSLLLAILFPQLVGSIFVGLGTIYLFIFGFIKVKLELFGKKAFLNNNKRFQVLTDTITGLRTVKIYNMNKQMMNRYTEWAVKVHRNLSISATLSDLPRYLIEAIGFMAIVGYCLGLIIFSNSNSSYTNVFPTLGIVGIAGMRMLPGIQSIYIGFSKLKFGSEPMAALIKDLNIRESDSNSNYEPFQLSTAAKLQISNVSFKHVEDDKLIFENINLKVSAGQKIAILGPSGVGKSTLLDLIAGLKDPTSGSIHINESTFGIEDKLVSYVTQDTFIFGGTIRYNILLKNEKRSKTDSFIMEKIELLGLTSILNIELADPLETDLGDLGSSLSGGQRQRIGILRAIFADRPLMVLDEPSSALDDENSHTVLALVKSLKDVTVILTTHKENLLEDFDQVLTLSQSSLI